METSLEPENPEFHTWDSIELFNHLIDLHQIPYESEFDEWRWLKNDMIRMCEETYEHANR